MPFPEFHVGHPPTYPNENPAPETRDMEITPADVEQFATVLRAIGETSEQAGARLAEFGRQYREAIGGTGIRVTYGSQVWRISAADPLPDTPVFYLDEMGPTPDWVYGPDGEWIRVEPEPRTWRQATRDIFDWIVGEISDRIDAMVQAWNAPEDHYGNHRDVGGWQPARPGDHQGLMHGFHRTFDASDVTFTQVEMRDEIRRLMIYPPNHRPHPEPEFDSYYDQQDLDQHGLDGGVPMSLEDLIGAEAKMDAIDRLLSDEL